VSTLRRLLRSSVIVVAAGALAADAVAAIAPQLRAAVEADVSVAEVNEQYQADRDPIAFPSCDKPDRGARSVRGEGPLGGGRSSSSSPSGSTSRSTGRTTPTTPKKGGSAGTTTPTPTATEPPTPTTSPTTSPPADPGD
jgi:hypothetical protein